MKLPTACLSTSEHCLQGRRGLGSGGPCSLSQLLISALAPHKTRRELIGIVFMLCCLCKTIPTLKMLCKGSTRVAITGQSMFYASHQAATEECRRNTWTYSPLLSALLGAPSVTFLESVVHVRGMCGCVLFVIVDRSQV